MKAALLIVVSSMLAAACKTECDHAIANVVHVSWAETVAAATPAGKQAAQQFSLDEDAMRPAMTRIATKRISPRCGDAKFVECVKNAKTTLEISGCDDP